MDRSLVVNVDTHDGMKSAERLAADHQAWSDQQHVITACLFCDWRYEGPAAAGRALSLAHRREKHPDAVKQPRRRGRKPSLQGDPGSGAERLRGMSFVKDTDGVVEAELVAEQRREIARKYA